MLLKGSHPRCVSYNEIFYGLKESPQAWFAKFSGLLSTFGFTFCTADPIVLIKKTQGSLVILAYYVDDILLYGSDDTSTHATKTYLQRHLSIRDLGSS